MAVKLTPQQRRLLREIVKPGRKIKDPKVRRIYRRAAAQTALVESNISNPSYGDADSEGWRQERRSLYRNPTNVKASARRFRDEFLQHYDPGEKSFEVAAQVQRPAAQYRDRYRQRAGDARSALKQIGKGGGKPGRRSRGGGSQTTMGVRRVTETTPGVDRSEERRMLLFQYLQDRGRPDALLQLGAGLRSAQDTPSESRTKLVPVEEKLKPGKTLVIGDSLGVGTVPYLKKMVGGRVVSNVKTGRPSRNGVSILKRNPGDYSRIVLDLGTNDGSAKELAKSIRKAKRLAPGADIFIPTVNGPDAERKNRVIRRLAGGNVHVVDWDAQLGGDGIHATPDGYRDRARQLARAMGEQPKRLQKSRGKVDGRDILESFYNGPGGRNTDEGRQVGRGFVSGHQDHVHFAAKTHKEAVQIAKIARDRFGLTVRELAPFDKVDPVHVQGSFHYSGRAADVSGDPDRMAAFSRWLARRVG